MKHERMVILTWQDEALVPGAIDRCCPSTFEELVVELDRAICSSQNGSYGGGVVGLRECELEPVTDMIQTKLRPPSEPCARFGRQLVEGDWILCCEFEAHWHGADGVLFRCINLETLKAGVVMLHPDQAARLDDARPGLWGETLARMKDQRESNFRPADEVLAEALANGWIP